MYRVIRVLNNNGVLVYDMDQREEAILLGNGVGFGRRVNERFELPQSDNVKRYSIVDREDKDRTGRQVIGGMNPLYLEAASRIVETGRQLLGEMNPNIMIPLADHIAYAVERVKTGITFHNPYHSDIKALYPEEYQAAQKAEAIIREMTGCRLPEEETGYIALHIRAGRMDEKLEESLKTVALLEKAVSMVEEGLGLKLDSHSFMYERFMSHLKYLVVCTKNGDPVSLDMDEYAKKQFPQSYGLAGRICSVMGKELGKPVPKEAVGHLAIHMERLKAD